MTAKKNLVWCHLWTIHENSPRKVEGELCSLHPDLRSVEAFVEAYWNEMPTSTMPDIFMAPTRQSDMRTRKVLFPCVVDDRTHELIVNSPLGLLSATVPQDTRDAVALIPPEDLSSLAEQFKAA